MLKITDVIYSFVGIVKGLKTLEFIKLIHEKKDRSGWTRLSYEEFQEHGLYPDTLKRVLKECQDLKIIEIEEDERLKGTKKGAVPKKYKLIFPKIQNKKQKDSSD